jgi:hypothetical protein
VFAEDVTENPEKAVFWLASPTPARYNTYINGLNGVETTPYLLLGFSNFFD